MRDGRHVGEHVFLAAMVSEVVCSSYAGDVAAVNGVTACGWQTKQSELNDVRLCEWDGASRLGANNCSFYQRRISPMGQARARRYLSVLKVPAMIQVCDAVDSCR